tara:strand:- start:587 stop:1081 length:495 start_codon:yes stop_codon:yes gene_type:complete
MNKFNKKAISNLEGKVARGEYSEAELEKLLLKEVIDKKTYDDLIERFFQDISKKSVEELEEELTRLTKLKQDSSDKKTIEKIKNDMDREIKKLKEEINILDSTIANNSGKGDIPPIEFTKNDLKGRIEDTPAEIISEKDKDRTGFYAIVFAIIVAFTAVFLNSL